MFSYIEIIMMKLLEAFKTDYNDIYTAVNNRINLEYTARDMSDMVLNDLALIDDFYIGDDPNLIDAYDKNYIMLYPITNYEYSVNRRQVNDPKISLHVSLDIVIGYDDPEILNRLLFRHIAAIQEFLLQKQDLLPDIITSMTIKSYQFYNTLVKGNTYLKALRFNLIIRYIGGEYEM